MGRALGRGTVGAQQRPRNDAPEIHEPEATAAPWDGKRTNDLLGVRRAATMRSPTDPTAHTWQV
ncbi:hypothetical protein [Candidatus Viridilinea mediisalina]|uniref:Uncharacterized protein n=1 Tax=Candidatus Viridilinea mediisalina TaxID=2024553 RepID=A0A2A6RMP0_9CHLR|nr:hypothetical protein [Candidatus Viridilinea mediisalina]PDW04322.1 hypothetical protein CJ255_03975 [Candidatus Viridilinea mediisalina]